MIRMLSLKVLEVSYFLKICSFIFYQPKCYYQPKFIYYKKNIFKIKNLPIFFLCFVLHCLSYFQLKSYMFCIWKRTKVCIFYCISKILFIIITVIIYRCCYWLVWSCFVVAKEKYVAVSHTFNSWSMWHPSGCVVAFHPNA